MTTGKAKDKRFAAQKPEPLPLERENGEEDMEATGLTKPTRRGGVDTTAFHRRSIASVVGSAPFARPRDASSNVKST
jgi:hypothetical protein